MNQMSPTISPGLAAEVVRLHQHDVRRAVRPAALPDNATRPHARPRRRPWPRTVPQASGLLGAVAR